MQVQVKLFNLEIKSASSKIYPMLISRLATKFPNPFSASHHPHFTACLHRRCSASATPNPNPDLKLPIFSLEHHLVASYGFSPHKATKISKPMPHLKSPDKPDAVLRFLNHQGFSEADIKTLIIRNPNILSSSPEKTLNPNINALRGMGLSSSTLAKIIIFSPAALQRPSAISRIQFWRDFLGGNEPNLIRAFKSNLGLVTHDIDKSIEPKMSLLQSHRLSTQDIARIVLTIPHFITSSVCSMKSMLKRTKELGFQPESGMFVHGLRAVACITRETFEKKVELLRSFGWSDDEFLTAFRKVPTMILLSEENLRAKMEFLFGEAKCEISYIAFRPVLLLHSLEKKLRPRLRVLHLLESNGLLSRGQGFYRAMQLADNNFIKEYVIPHIDAIPQLLDDYLAACSSDPITTLELES